MLQACDPPQFRCTRRFEAQAFRRGWRVVAGCDEVGRGALLGPLYAAAVILDPAQPIPGLDDSKKLSPEERTVLDVEVRAKAIAFQVVAVGTRDVETLNVYVASRHAMVRALESLTPRPDFVPTDAMPLADLHQAQVFPIPHRALIHGDARSVSIAAASIIAKVARDSRMRELAEIYPRYHLADNKGYGTPEHLEALARYGPCPEHRQTFQPVKNYLLPLFPFSGQP
jgi:ribonuclease HII